MFLEPNLRVVQLTLQRVSHYHEVDESFAANVTTRVKLIFRGGVGNVERVGNPFLICVVNFDISVNSLCLSQF